VTSTINTFCHRLVIRVVSITFTKCLFYYPNMPISKVWIYRLLFCVCVCVCTVTDFSAEDKASGVTFCSAVNRRPRQGISHFGGTLLPQKPKIGRIGQRTGHAHLHVNITIETRRHKRHVIDAPFMKCGVRM